MSTGIPTLRLELEGMRHSVQFALSSHALAMDQMLLTDTAQKAALIKL